MNIEVKFLSDRAEVSKAHPSDAGLDLACTSVESYSGFIEYGTGVAISIPSGYVGLLFPRSSVSNKSLSMANSVGVIDSGYRGELKVRMRRLAGDKFSGYSVGDKVAQLVIMPLARYNIIGVEEFSSLESARGAGGFGSTGA